MENNHIDNKIIDINGLSLSKLNACVSYLNQNFGGIELRDIPSILTQGLESIRDEINTALKVLNNFIYPDAADFVVTGQKKLVDSSDFYSIEKVKNLVEDFYLTRKHKGTLPSAYSYECKTCTVQRITKRRKISSIVEDLYPDW